MNGIVRLLTHFRNNCTTLKFAQAFALMNFRLCLALAVILLLNSGQVAMAAGGYHVEALLFFQPLDAQENGDEAWPDAPINFWQLEPNLLRREISPTKQATADAADRPFIRVAAKTLLGANKKLKSKPGYRVQQLAAWELPPLRKAASPMVSITGPTQTPAAPAPQSPDTPPSITTAEGGIQTYILGNFLYLLVDICRTVREPGSPSAETGTWVAGTLDVSRDVRFCIREKRRIKLGELNYFDHPGMGLLVRVDRAENFERPKTQPPVTADATTDSTSKSTGQ